MNSEDLRLYEQIHAGAPAYRTADRGLIEVSGGEAVQFLDGMISNDMKTLEDGAQMAAAFPNAQGRLIAAVRVKRDGGRFLFDTESATRERVFQNLHRFTFAGDFHVRDLTEELDCVEVIGKHQSPDSGAPITFSRAFSETYFIPRGVSQQFIADLENAGIPRISNELYNVIRLEQGVPSFEIDVDENTVVPELGDPAMISYNKGCYIGQEVIARIHFRGHVAKQLAGLVIDGPDPAPGSEILTLDGKNAGTVRSAVFSPKLNSQIALAFVRYHFLAAGTELSVNGTRAVVHTLPFVELP